MDSKMQEHARVQALELLKNNMKMVNSPQYEIGNSNRFNPDYVTFDATSPLAGKKIAFLGSSITYGFAAKDVSFVDYLAAKDGVEVTKSAVSGTTLAGLEKDGYLERLYGDFKADQHYDLFVCQLSTNDYQLDKELGEITPSAQEKDFKRNTTLGAIEEIARYVKSELRCPLAFYTCPQKEPVAQYKQLIAQLNQLQKKWKFAIIDLFNDAGLLASTKAHPNAMIDNIHPTREGYLKIWLPVFERELIKTLNN